MPGHDQRSNQSIDEIQPSGKVEPASRRNSTQTLYNENNVDGWDGNASITAWDFLDAESRAFSDQQASQPPPSSRLEKFVGEVFGKVLGMQDPFQPDSNVYMDPRIALQRLKADARRRWEAKFPTRSSLIGYILPPFLWLRSYSLRRLLGDVLAGIAVFSMVAPQGLSYASACGQLPREFGLFSSFLPPIVYGVLGHQRQLALGPVLIVSQLVADTIDPLMPEIWSSPSFWYAPEPRAALDPTTGVPIPIAESSDRRLYKQKPWDGEVDWGEITEDCAEVVKHLRTWPVSVLASDERAHCRPYMHAELQSQYTSYAIQMTLLVGLMQIFLGMIGLDFITNFLSPSVLSGFTTGAAVVIGLGQVGALLGFPMGPKSTLQGAMSSIVKKIPESRLSQAMVSLAWILLLLSFKVLGKRFVKARALRVIGPLIVVILSIIVAAIWTTAVDASLETGVVGTDLGVKLLRPLTHNYWTVANAAKLFPGATATALLSLVEILQAGRASDNVRKAVAPGPEYRVLGLSNLVSSLFSGYVVAGSHARTQVLTRAGGSTPMTQVVTGILTGVSIFVLGPVYRRIPKSAMAAIVFSAALGLLDFRHPVKLWRVAKKDLLTWVTCFVVSLFFGLRLGLVAAVGLAILWVIYESTFPHTAVLGRIPGTTVYRNTQQYPNAEEVDRVLIVRLDAPLFFANTVFIRDKIGEYLEHAQNRAADKGFDIEFLILELSPVTRIDSTALAMLRDLWHELEYFNIVLVLVNPNIEVMRALDRSGIAKLVDREFIFLRCHDAVRYCLAKLDMIAEEDEEDMYLANLSHHNPSTDAYAHHHHLQDPKSYDDEQIMHREPDSMAAAASGLPPRDVRSDPVPARAKHRDTRTLAALDREGEVNVHIRDSHDQEDLRPQKTGSSNQPPVDESVSGMLTGSVSGRLISKVFGSIIRNRLSKNGSQRSSPRRPIAGERTGGSVASSPGTSLHGQSAGDTSNGAKPGEGA